MPITLTNRRCKVCGRFTTGSGVGLCPRCSAVAPTAQQLATADAGGFGSTSSDFGRILADLGLDSGSLPRDAKNRNFSPPLDSDMASEATSGGQSLTVQPPLPGFLNPPGQAAIETVLPPPPGLPPRPSDRDGAGKPVLTRIGPVATAQAAREQLARERSLTGTARRRWAEAGRAARPVAIGVALISVSAALGAAVPLLLSLLGK